MVKVSSVFTNCTKNPTPFNMCLIRKHIILKKKPKDTQINLNQNFWRAISNHLPDTKCVLFRKSINYRMKNTKITTHSNVPADLKAGTSFN